MCATKWEGGACTVLPLGKGGGGRKRLYAVASGFSHIDGGGGGA